MKSIFMRKNISLFIVATLTLLLVMVPVRQTQAGVVVDSVNAGLDVAGQTTDPGNNLDAGWVYTASATYTLGRIEAKFATTNGVPITIEFYSGPPSLGGTLLASGTFTPTAAAPAGTVWEGADLNNTVSIVSGNTYMVGFKNFYSSPTSDAAGAASQIYFSGAADNYAILGTGADNNTYKLIARFFSADPPTITSAAPPNGTQGVAYSHTYTATGSDTITFSATPGSLPPGLNLSAAGVLSGTPTTPGIYTGTVTASNGATPNDTQNFSITIASSGTAPTITSGAPPNGTQGVAYSHTYTATGSATITYSATPGSLPPGLNLSAAGVLSGTPTTPGLYTGTVTATNGVAPDDTQNFSITISAPSVAPTITSGAPPNGTDGVAYTHTYTATGTATITYSATPGSLPPGLNLSAAGVLSGTPTTPGLYTGTVTATNGIAPDDTQNFSITIASVAPTITSVAPPNGAQGVAYTHTYTATGSGTITYSATPGSLPPGLNLSAAGVLSGTPTTPGLYTGTVTATNGTAPDATQNFSITISATAIAPTITSAAPPNGTQGVAYSHTYTASGTATITFSATPGSLPPGLNLSAAGVLSGTPTTPGLYTGTVTATNGTAPDDTQNFSITISAAGGITLSPATLPNGTVSTAYSQTISATGGTGPYTFTVTAGTPPTGLNLSTAGVLSGTPTATGTFNFTVTATDTVPATGTQTYTIVISSTATPPPSQPVVVELPTPPPAPFCTDTNFEEVGMIRTHFTNDADRAGLSCRLMAANGSYMTWLGGPLTNAGMIGNKTVLDLGLIAAVDVFSGSGKTGFIGDVDICLKGSGYMIYMNANSSPRVPQLWSAWKTDAFPGYTCTTLYAPGTVILVKNKP